MPVLALAAVARDLSTKNTEIGYHLGPTRIWFGLVHITDAAMMCILFNQQSVKYRIKER